MSRVVIGFVVIALAASAHRAAAAPRAVGLAEALAADAEAPAARAEDLRAGAADADARAAGPWPATSLSIATSRLTARLITTLAIPLPLGGEPAAARRVARAQAAAAHATTDAVRLDRRLAITVAWLALARAQAIVELADQSVARARELEAAAQARLDAGDVPAVDVEAARADRIRVEVEARGAVAEAGARGAELAGLLGWDPAIDVVADGGLPEPVAPPPLDELRRIGPAHPEARLAEAGVAAARAAVDQSRRQRWPALALDVEVSAFDPTQAGTDLRAGVTVDLPVFGRGAARLDAARAGERVARAEAVAARGRLDAAIVAAHRRAIAAVERARTFTGEVLPAQTRAAELATRAYREGAADLSSALLAQRELLAVRVEVIGAIDDAAIAQAELARAIGAAP